MGIRGLPPARLFAAGSDGIGMMDKTLGETLLTLTRRQTLAHALAWPLALAAGRTARAAADAQGLVFGVLNQQSPTLTAERWNPILTYVTQKTGVKLKLRMGPTVERTNEMMAHDEFDFVFTNHNFKPEYDSLGLKVIARWGKSTAAAAIAVPEDSAFHRIEDLADHRIAFPSPHAFLAYAVPLVRLRSAGVTVHEVFAGNQEGVLAQLKARRVDAIAVNSRYLTQYSEREGVAFRTIWTSDPYPDLAVVVHPRVDADTTKRVREALVGMVNDPAAKDVLERAACPGFAAATDHDYEAVRTVYRLAAK
jgi:phosphonate transport system substrate-binding protein